MAFKSIHVTIGAAVVLFGIPVQAFAANLLTNGSFETGDLTGWTLSGTSSDGYVALIESDSSTASSNSPDAAGNHIIYYDADYANTSLSQNVYLKTGRYEIGFSSKLFSYQNSGDEIFNELVGSTIVQSVNSANTSTGWESYVSYFNIKKTGTYTVSYDYLTSYHPSKDLEGDQFYVVAVPESTTWVMMLVGFSAIGFAARRRQAVTLTYA